MDRGAVSGSTLDAFDPPTVPVTSARPPVRRQGLVERPALVEALAGADAGQVVVVVAPAGYGKTTTALLWDSADPRPFAWAQLGPADDDPVHFVQHLALAVHQVHPLPGAARRVLLGAGRSVELDLVPALARALEQVGPLVLVVDDVHCLGSSEARDSLDGLASLLPGAVTLALLSRADTIPLARRRVEGGVLEIGPDQLAMGPEEALGVLAADGVVLAEEDVTGLVAQTEGWPAGLHLAAVAARNRAGAPALALSGRDRRVTDYLVEEVLVSLPADQVTFLEETSVLPELRPELIDLLLEREGSGAMLAEAERSAAVFVVPLDDERQRYRYHHLFGEMLQERLRSRDRARHSALQRRASELLYLQGDHDGAIRLAVAVGDVDRAADLILIDAIPLVTSGRVGRLGQWLDLIGEEAMAESPAAAVAWAWYGASVGDPTLVARGTAAAAQAGDQGPLADGSPSPAVAVNLLRAMAGLDGVEAVARDAALVRAAGGPGENPWWRIATTVEMAAVMMLERFDEARELFQRIERVPGGPLEEAVALAWVAILELEAGQGEAARHAAGEALRLAERHDLEGVTSAASVYATNALVAAEDRRTADALELSKATERILARLGSLSPRTMLLGYVLLARAALALGDPGSARVKADEARRAQQREPNAPLLNRWLDQVDAQLEAAGARGRMPDQALTPAELRLLPYLATHYPLGEIAERLHVSRNTAKTQCVAIYRKLGVQSRSAAVEAARARGYLSA